MRDMSKEEIDIVFAPIVDRESDEISGYEYFVSTTEYIYELLSVYYFEGAKVTDEKYMQFITWYNPCVDGAFLLSKAKEDGMVIRESYELYY